MSITLAPYGHWPSDWSAEQAACASADFAELEAGHGGLYWVRYNPADSRCTLWFWDGAGAECLTPPGFSLRSRVYEYGGGCLCLTGRDWVFVNESDQQLYRQRGAGERPEPLTDRADCRYGGLVYDAAHDAVLAVEEQGGEPYPCHRLVQIGLADGARQVLAEGADFYAAPAVSADGQRLAWIEWSRPAQPWTATRLMLAERSATGLAAARCLAGEAQAESLQQPRFDLDGRLWVLSDRAGWWQPWFENGDELAPLAGMAPADHAPAPWQLGVCSYLPQTCDELLLTRFEDGFGVLCARRSGGERRLASGFSRFRQLCADQQRYYAIAGAPDRLPAVIALERASGRVQIISGGERPLAPAQLSRPESQRFATGAGEWAQAFFYPPRNGAARSPGRRKPPLVVFLHGGPTSAAYPVFDPRIQFWTQRGFAVADLNYRGSSGFGRAQRMRLAGAWGEVEVEDAAALVAHLAECRRIDPAQAFIRGASAGGYTALLALAFTRAFCGGASLYGVSDPLSLRRATHKFEADYLDWLIGDPERDAARYARRTPLYHAERIVAPVIFFQGGKDRVVVPAQTESMVAALRQHGVPVAYHVFADEGHGFRQAKHLAQALEQEWQFYCRCLSETAADAPPFVG